MIFLKVGDIDTVEAGSHFLSPFRRFDVQIGEAMTPSESIQHAAAEFIRDRRPLEAFVYVLARHHQMQVELRKVVGKERFEILRRRLERGLTPSGTHPATTPSASRP